MDTATTLLSKLEELFEVLPLHKVMGSLVVKSQASASHLQSGEVVRLHGIEHSDQISELAVLAHHDAVSIVSDYAEVLAGLWLYVDDLDRSHTISQDIHTPTGSYWHAIMHRREGDFWNAKYWFRKVGNHPVIGLVGYDPSEFVDACERDRGENSPELLELQRREWKALFEWCLKEAGLA